jgi:hypothetical protein
MKIWSHKIGPTEYFSGIATVCCLIPYAWRFPKFWPVCIAVTLVALAAYRRFLRKHDSKLRDWTGSAPTKIQSYCFTIFVALVFGNALLIGAL